MILHYAPHTRAFRARWMLEELDVPYELRRVELSRGEQRTPEYRSVHPLGAVPALVDGDLRLIESAAICLHLADRFAERGLAPEVTDPARGTYYQWSVFAVATLDPLVAPPYARALRVSPERRRAIATDDEHERFGRAIAALRAPLLSAPYLLGTQLTTADVLVGSVLAWADAVGLLQTAPDLVRYLRRLEDRSAYQRASLD